MLDQQILSKLDSIEKELVEQKLLKKAVLNFREACNYLSISESHLYKLTSRSTIPHYCPQGKKLYFNRAELDDWLQTNRKNTTEEVEIAAINYLIQNKRKGL